MAPDTTANPSLPGLSLYANLLGSLSKKDAATGTISRGPVVFKQPAGDEFQQNQAAAERQQISAAALRFQPTKRPQLFAHKSKPRPSLQRAAAAAPSATPSDLATVDSTDSTVRPSVKTTLADWTGEGEDNVVNGFYGGEKRQRGGRKKRKKNKEESHVPQNWDDIYDPSRPNNYEHYKHSDEKIMEIREWKNKLYAHRLARRQDIDSDSSSDYCRPQLIKSSAPSGLSFAPPSFDETERQLQPFQPLQLPSEPTGGDAYDRCMHISRLAESGQTPNPHRPDQQIPPPPPSPPKSQDEIYLAQSSPSLKAKASVPPRISRAPVRYNLPDAPSETPVLEAELGDALQIKQAEDQAEPNVTSRSLRPGQKGFAERLMSKYGWSKGSGLGANESGIVNPLRVQIEKQKKKPDSEGGGFVGPGGRGKIVGGNKRGSTVAETDEGKFGPMSEVVVLHGMIDGMDIDAEIEDAGDGGLMQEIGEECGEKYGRVERVFVDRSNLPGAAVFIKFTSQLSALRAVNALEGRTFNGNSITARFFDTGKFEEGTYH